MPQRRDFNTDDPNEGSQAKTIKPPAVRPQTLRSVPVPSATGGKPGVKLTKLDNPNGLTLTKVNNPAPTAVQTPAYKRLKFQNPASGSVLMVDPPAFSAADIAKNDPATVQRFSDMLWSVYKRLPAEQREQPFWKGVRANAQGAAASLVARLQTNIQNAPGGNTPKLDEAMRARMQQNEVYQLLSYIDYADRNF